MCTFVVLRRPGDSWPLIIAANRDEMRSRPWLPPGRHWADRPAVVGGLDVLGGGTWLARNDHWVVAAVLNRINTLGPAAGARSRGELPLLALTQATARAAAAVLAGIDARAYRPFNAVVADACEGFWIRAAAAPAAGGGDPGPAASLEVLPLPEGLSMLTAYDLNAAASPRIRRYLPRFRAAAVPDPGEGDWRGWQALLADRTSAAGAGPGGAMTIVTGSGFGTVSASLLALPAAAAAAAVWLFAAGPPDEVAFQPVGLAAGGGCGA